MELEVLLGNIVDRYEALLVCYENVYRQFMKADCLKMDEYIDAIGGSRDYISSIFNIQHQIEEYRAGLKEFIKNDALIDNVIDLYSGGRVTAIIERIELIIKSLQSFESRAKAALMAEMGKIRHGLDEIGIDEQYLRFLDMIISSDEFRVNYKNRINRSQILN